MTERRSSSGRWLIEIVAVIVLAFPLQLMIATPSFAKEMIPGTAWLEGHGVPVCYPLGRECPGVTPAPGEGPNQWQCVELAARLYETLRWVSRNIYVSYAYQMGNAGWASSYGLIFHPNGSSYIPVPGDLIILNKLPGAAGPTNAGHVSIVSDPYNPSRGTIPAVEENYSPSGKTSYALSGSVITRPGDARPILGTIHAPGDPYTNQNPSIRSISPSSAPWRTPVTITGTNLAGPAPRVRVTFNGVPATITSDTATQIVTSVPGYATTGNVTVTTPSGTASFPFTVFPTNLSGDFNGDGKTDLMAVRYSSTSVMLSNGSGFTAPKQWSNTPFAGTVALLAGDVNGDGKADLIAVNDTSTWVMLSKGHAFGPPREWANGAFFGTKVTLAVDVNGDGKTDLVAVNGDSTWVMLSTGDGFDLPHQWANGAFFGSKATQAADLNGDGKSDLVAVNGDSTWVMLSTGGGFSAPVQWARGAFFGSRATLDGDVNGDGKADLIAMNGDSTWVMLSNGEGFGPPQEWSTSAFNGSVGIFAGDMTGDGSTDLIALNPTSTWVMLSSNHVFGGFSAPQQWSNGRFNGTVALLTGDVNGDGRSDLIAVNDKSTWVMLSNGHGFSAPGEWASGAFFGTKVTLVGDVNGDGKADLVAVNHTSTWVMLSNGHSFGPPQQWQNGAFYGSRATLVGDLNGDRKADLIAVNYDPATSTGQTWVMLSNGHGFNPPQKWSSSPFTGSNAVLAADVNRDGKVDLVAQNYYSVSVMTSNGTAFNPPHEWASTAANGDMVVAGDVNGDRRSDLITCNYLNCLVMASNGSSFARPVQWSSGPFAGTRAFLTGDVSGDRKADLIAVNYAPSTNTGSTWVETSTGSASNSPPTAFEPPFQAAPFGF